MIAEIEAQEKAFAVEIAAQFAEVISHRRPCPKPEDCADLAGRLAGVLRGRKLPDGARIVGKARTPELLNRMVNQINVLLETLSEIERLTPALADWQFAADLKAALEQYKQIVPRRKPGERGAAANVQGWQEIVLTIEGPARQALLNAGWNQVGRTDNSPLPAIASWALKRVWKYEVKEQAIARYLRKRSEAESAASLGRSRPKADAPTNCDRQED